MFEFAVIAICVGVVVGLFSGLLGIGGGTLMVSIFNIAYGLSGIQATATSLFTIIPTSISGAATHLRNKTCVWQVGVAAGIGGALTSPAGVWLASISPEICVILGAVFVIAYSAITMLRKASALRHSRLNGDGANTVAFCTQNASQAGISSNEDGANTEVTQLEALQTLHDSPVLNKRSHSVAKAMAIGLLAGVVSGYVGVGGGFLMVPLFLSVLKMPMKVTSGSSLIAVMILAIPGTIAQAYLGNIDWLLGISVAAGSMPGAILGARLVKRIPELSLRYLFGAFLLLSALMLLANQFI